MPHDRTGVGRNAGGPGRVVLTTVLAGFVTAAMLGGCAATTPSRQVTPSSSITTTTTTTSTTPPTTTTAPPAPHLSLGSTGPAVLALQQDLSALGYWLGPPTGKFDDATQQAVYALQKAAGLERDGIVGPLTEDALQRGVAPQPRSTTGYVIEVDLAADLLMVVQNGKLEWTLNTSTGGGYWYSDDGVSARAETPTGQFHVYRQVDGLVVDRLGQLWRPKFFDDGFAIHGDSYVPPEPVSHGCVRISDEAIDWVWADNVIPMGTEVWVYN